MHQDVTSVYGLTTVRVNQTTSHNFLLDTVADSVTFGVSPMKHWVRTCTQPQCLLTSMVVLLLLLQRFVSTCFKRSLMNPLLTITMWVTVNQTTHQKTAMYRHELVVSITIQCRMNHLKFKDFQPILLRDCEQVSKQ